jgi:uncharacterized repeat protein (TIGR02543 family)
MHDYLPEANWHYYFDGTTEYPSCNGLSVKWISKVNIYSQPPAPWEINVTGIVTQPVSQEWFENALACHETQSWTDPDTGDVWSGLPLWYLCGLADDTTIHGPGAFNDEAAAAGYTVQVTASDGFYKQFSSIGIARSNDYIIANRLNGVRFTDGDSYYPLRLVGNAITSKGQRVSHIASIDLLDVPVFDQWQLELSGATDYTMTRSEFASGAACHGPFEYVDPDAGTYSGMPLWYLCGWVDDDIQHGAGAFNDALAATPYQVKVIDGAYAFTFDSDDIARNNDFLVANKLNGEDLPEDMYPLRLVGEGFGPDVGSGWKVRQITRIELLNLPSVSYTLTTNIVGSGTVTRDPDQATYEPGTPVTLTAVPAGGYTFSGWSGDASGLDNPLSITMDANKNITATFVEQQWSLQLNGMTQYTMLQSEFQTLASTYPLSCVVTNKDGSEDTYTGVAMWRLIGMVDDNDTATMNADYAALNYDITMIASDGFNKSLTSTEVLNNDMYIVANQMNGAPLPADKYPLRVVWTGATSGKMVSKLATLQFAIPWNVELDGASTYVMPNTEFETAAAANPASWADGANTWEGLALWRLVGMVDDADPLTFNDSLAAIGYDVKITAIDGYNKTFSIADIARNDTRIIANKYNAYTLPPNRFPIRFVGPGLSGSLMVSKIVKIELVNLPSLMDYFGIDRMVVDYGRMDDRDAVYMSANFTLPSGATYDLAADAVRINIDGYIIDIPAGSFKNLGGYVPFSYFNNTSKNFPADTFRDRTRNSQTYVYRNFGFNTPDIVVVINFKTGKLNLTIRKADVDVIDNYDGVSVTFSIDNIVGTDTINMYIDALTYPRQR